MPATSQSVRVLVGGLITSNRFDFHLHWDYASRWEVVGMKDPRELHKQLEQEVARLVAGDEWAAMLEVASRFHRYSFRNALLIRLQRPDASRVAGYKAWQSLGRQVRKGEKGIQILAPCVYSRKPEEGEEESEPLRVLRGFRVAHVFDVAQTQGAELPDVRPELLEGSGPAGLWDALAHQVQALGFALERGACPIPGANGCTDWLRHVVTVRADLPPAQACKTLAHELAHAKLHGPGTLCRDVAEVEAESVAYIVCAASGLESSSYSLAYVAGWAGGDVKLVVATGEKVSGCASEILAGLGLQEEQSGQEVAA
jgi:hypothetical protein